MQKDDVRIITATVSIRVMRVGTKQMTQAVFRQLPHADIISEDWGMLIAEPWGWVNYDAVPDYRNVIFSLADQLYCSRVRIWHKVQVDPEIKIHEEPWHYDAVAKKNVEAKRTEIRTGRWYVSGENVDGKYRVLKMLPTEETARAYAHDLIDSLRVIKNLPQLFIAV